jgi:hypothetical protein
MKPKFSPSSQTNTMPQAQPKALEIHPVSSSLHPIWQLADPGENRALAGDAFVWDVNAYSVRIHGTNIP